MACSSASPMMPLRLVGERAVQRDVVALQHLVEAGLAHAEGLHGGLVHVGVRGQHGEAEGLRPQRDGPADAPQTDDAEGLVADAVGLAAGLVVPASVEDAAVVAQQVAAQGEQEAHGVVGDLLRAVVGHVGDDDAALGGGVHVHAVEARGHERDDAHLGQGVKDAGGERRVGADQGVGVAAHASISASSPSSS